MSDPEGINKTAPSAVFTGVSVSEKTVIMKDKAVQCTEPSPIRTTIEETVYASDDDFLNCFNRYSSFLGFLVGCFIQSSSLGANYILTILFGHEREVIQANREYIYAFSLVWSLMTALMGIMILFFLRSLIVIHRKSSSEACDRKNEREADMLRVHLEYSFAFGALAGVCVSWTLTDVVLGLKVHAYHSIATLCIASVGKFLVELCSASDMDIDEDNNLAEPLLLDEDSDDESSSTPRKVAKVTTHSKATHSEFKFKGISIGLLVGFFIQFSSLGASFMLDAVYGEDHARHISKQDLLIFSLAWSFLFGTMGVMILLMLRELVYMVLQRQQKKLTNAVCEALDRLCLNLEFFFAMGCLLGVNLAWVLTDLGLGFKAHIALSIATLAAASLLCKVLAYFFFSSAVEPEDADDEECERKHLEQKMVDAIQCV